jgi:hypothetical protein
MKRYEITCTASQTITRYATTLRGVLWHVGRLNGRVSVLDTKHNREIYYGDAWNGYSVIRCYREDIYDHFGKWE